MFLVNYRIRNGFGDSGVDVLVDMSKNTKCHNIYVKIYYNCDLYH